MPHLTSPASQQGSVQILVESLFFEDTADAVRAALAIRADLAAGRCNVTCGGGPGVAARMSLTTGEVVIGVVGSSVRHAIALVGPSVNIGARLLKHVRVGGIIASADVVAALRDHAPDLADVFGLADRAFDVPGGDGLSVVTYQASDSSEQPAPISGR
jgi:class 3 adenylate cyclase